MKRLKDLEDSVSPNAGETDLRKMISDLMGRLTALERRLKTLEDGKKPTGRGGASPEK